MVKPDLVSGKVARAKGWLDQAESLIFAPLPELMQDADRRDLASFRLFLAIQECIDLAARNRIAHGYSTVDHALIQRQFQEGAATLRRFLARVSSEAGL